MKRNLKNDRLAWWREARFGLFIHWGLYAIPAGVWKGKEVEGIGEWIMFRARIPVAEYKQLARRFHPVKFDARAVVKLAKDAGMKYLVITSKHHDGFAMFRSAHPYNIVDATPYRRDPMKDLARECRKAGLKLGFYYSQYQDWEDPNGARNDWDYDEASKDLDEYLRRKVKPQLRELLTQYGPVGLIWFDTPGKMTRRQSLDLKRMVHRLQPGCLVSGRVGNGVGDYGSLGDNHIPAGRVRGDWETPATLNDTWGYKKNDRRWKPVGKLLLLLSDLAGKGVNYLLNIGPRADGSIPRASVSRLREIGRWMDRHGEAIAGAGAGPFPHELPGVRMTSKPGRLYLMFQDWPRGGRYTLYGLRNRVRSASVLSNPRLKIGVSQRRDTVLGRDVLELELPCRKPDRWLPVVRLGIEGSPSVDASLFQQADGVVRLPAHRGVITARSARLDSGGIVKGWTSERDSIGWEFKLAAPGAYRVKVVTAAMQWPRQWRGGHRVRAIVGRRSVSGELRGEEKIESPRAEYHPEAASRIGDLAFDAPGVYTLKLRAEKIVRAHPEGIALSEVILEPAKRGR